jgi:hypothetical protein
MRFQEIVSITGLPGLYQLLSTKSDGAIVKSIEDGSTKFVAARVHSVTALDGIEVYTEEDNMRLLEVFITMKNNIANATANFDASKADANALRAEFGKLFPQYDKDRVYVSDMKKMLRWFVILDNKNLLNPPTEQAATTDTETPVAEATPAEPAKATKPKATKAKAEPTNTTEPAADADAEKPKRTRKKKTEE